MNQIKDNRGLSTTVSSQSALDQYESALSQMLCYTGDPVETVEQAIQEDPDFILAHCLRAHAGGVMADGAFCDHVQESVTTLESMTAKANDREIRHIAGARDWLEGKFDSAANQLESVLVDHPGDTLALLVAHLFDFYRGDCHNLRDRVARVLPHYSEESAEYGYVLGMYAFGLEECNEYRKAEEIGKQAVELNSGDVWAIHAVAHVLEMEGRQDDGINWYESRKKAWSEDNGFAVHNWWHLALYYLDLQQFDKVLEIYDQSIADGTVALEMLDASALLWRLHLLKFDVGNRWEALCTKWEETIPWSGYYSFNDIHAVMAFVGNERFDLADKMLDKMENYAPRKNDSGMMLRNVGLPVGRALQAFGKGDYAQAAELLYQVRYIANQFGGSHAQRDLISQTLIESTIRAKQLNHARNLLAERSARKPNSPTTWLNTARVMDLLQCREEAERARTQVEQLLATSATLAS